MSIILEEKSLDETKALVEFFKHFNIHYDLLLRRYERFKEVNDICNNDIDVLTYLDIIVVQLRAMCIENTSLKKNYTAQVLLRKLGHKDLADKLDEMLDADFCEIFPGFSIRKALKTLADGFICHYDNFEGLKKDEWAMAATIEKQLRSPYHEHNLDYIMQVLIDCIGKGLSYE